jgi:acetyl esterase/lipase
LLVLVFFSIASCQSTRTDQIVAEGYVLEEDIVYGTGGDVELLLDLARPDAGKGSSPALIFLFGDRYAYGNKSFFHSEIQEAAKRGYVGVAINYRLTEEEGEDGQSKYQFPAQLHDAKCAVRWLRANSRKYRIDGSRIGVLGGGAGANLALMLGLTAPSDGLEGDCGKARVSSRVQAVVNLAGPTEMVLDYVRRSRYWRFLLGGSPEELPDRYKAASPVTYVTPDDPPVLTVCGTLDLLLPQEKLLDETMKAVGASHELIVVEGVGDQMYKLFDPYHDNAVWDFLEKHLKELE